MKSIIFYSALCCAMFFATQGNAQPSEKKVETEEFTVHGECGMCQQRIEKAAMSAKGVIMAKWDRTTQLLSVTYRPRAVDLDTVKEKVAASGHDTEELKADQSVYAALPNCCRYRDGVEAH